MSFVGRFTLLGALTPTFREMAAALGLALLVAAFVAIGGVSHSPAVVAGAGAIFGLGHNLAFPTLAVWVSVQFRAEDLAKPAALASALFKFGVYAAPSAS